jgi:hypothetical protein
MYGVSRMAISKRAAGGDFTMDDGRSWRGRKVQNGKRQVWEFEEKEREDFKESDYSFDIDGLTAGLPPLTALKVAKLHEEVKGLRHRNRDTQELLLHNWTEMSYRAGSAAFAANAGKFAALRLDKDIAAKADAALMAIVEDWKMRMEEELNEWKKEAGIL